MAQFSDLEEKSALGDSSDSLKSILKDRIIRDIIKDAQSKMKKAYSLIIADDVTIKILHHVFKMHELNELNIGVVLNVEYPRERVKVSPIYFLSPNQKSISKMCDDYKDLKNPRYGAPVHCYFCSSLQQSLIDYVKQSNVVKYLASFKEIPCDFLVIEKRVFSFDRDTAFGQLYINKDDRNNELTRTAKQLVSLMLSLNEEPYIRYSKDSHNANQLAKLIDNNLNEIRNILSNFTPNKDRATLIIMDRSDDPITPLLHELSFQAMVMDVLSDKILDNGSKIILSNDKDNEGRPLPDENDTVWTQYRHEFIGSVVETLPGQFKAWQDANAVAKFKKQSNNNNSNNNSNDTGLNSKDLIEAARAMPQYQTLIKQYTTNINMAHELINYFKEHDMKKLIELEQDIVTGISEDGKSCDRREIQTSCSSVLIDPNKPNELKLRMFMMYVISQGGMKPDQRKQLMTQSGFDDNSQHIIFNLSSLGVLLQSDKPIQGHKNKEYWKDLQSAAKSKSQTTSITRYTSYLEWVLESHRTNQLKTDYFPWIQAPSNNSNQKSQKTRIATSYRKHTNKNKDQNKVSSNDPRVIVFVLGGVSYSEMRACYQFSQKHKQVVFVGSTSIMNPKKYLELLGEKVKEDAI